ncbi:ferric iron uptake transcriptional regulator [Imhoffiella purpurea]|uniref:Ferric uptake regulation protein n=1 Tax=Imhoffiella purpurea TaxID=1249627 RepID=W9V9I9_9GAMM|nr:ferric iron uptake transcriptional regulator [Imhoffiella purpurea]EXJ16114.1 Ferric uptake regulation protein FUR [Imhoffiella purpurea]
MESQQIKQAGLKVTAPRVKILSILENCGKRHLSAEDVYKELLSQQEEIGLATVYRVLTQFESAGLVCRRHFEGGQSVFELNSGEHHDHLVCVKCGKIVEFADSIIEERQARIAAENGFEIEEHSLVIYGVCSESGCQKKA